MLLIVFALIVPIGVHKAHAASPTDWTRYPLIAHALGGIDGVHNTNSYESFKTNYEKGQRVFEVDLILTEDNMLAARHDWMGYLADHLKLNLPENRRDVPLTMKEFKKYKILDKYTSISFTDLARIMKGYPDVYFITDTKETDSQLITKQFIQIRDIAKIIDPTILERLIPEIYSPEMMTQVKRIIPFKQVIFSIYMSSMEPNEVVQYVRKNKIPVVAMPIERATDKFVNDLKKQGVVTYVHTVNKVEQFQKLREMGIQGIYTDYLTYKEVGIDSEALTIKTKSTVNALSATATEKKWDLIKVIFTETNKIIS